MLFLCTSTLRCTHPSFHPFSCPFLHPLCSAPLASARLKHELLSPCLLSSCNLSRSPGWFGREHNTVTVRIRFLTPCPLLGPFLHSIYLSHCSDNSFPSIQQLKKELWGFLNCKGSIKRLQIKFKLSLYCKNKRKLKHLLEAERFFFLSKLCNECQGSCNSQITDVATFTAKSFQGNDTEMTVHCDFTTNVTSCCGSSNFTVAGQFFNP